MEIQNLPPSNIKSSSSVRQFGLRHYYIYNGLGLKLGPSSQKRVFKYSCHPWIFVGLK